MKEALSVIWDGNKEKIESVMRTVNVNMPIDGTYPLEIAALRAFPDLEVVHLLIGLGADPNRMLTSGVTIIDEAKRLDRPSQIIAALEKAALCIGLQQNLPMQSGKSAPRSILKI